MRRLDTRDRIECQNGDLLSERGGKARATSKRWLSCHCVCQEYTNQRPFWYSTVPWRSSRDGVRILSCYYGEPKTMVGITSRMQIARLRVIVLIGYLCLCLVFYENLITILYFFSYNCDNYRQEALHSFIQFCPNIRCNWIIFSELRKEQMEARIGFLPLLQAEHDRKYVPPKKPPMALEVNFIYGNKLILS